MLGASIRLRRAKTASTRRKSSRFLPYWFIAPLMLMILILAVYPTTITLVQSFFRVDPLEPPTAFIGLGNFTALFSNPAVLQGAVNTAIYVVIGVALSTALGLGIAVAFAKPFPGRGWLLALVIVPWALPGVVEGVLWSWIYNPMYGMLNYLLVVLHLTGHYVTLLGVRHFLTIFLIEVVQVWQITPLGALLILAGLEAIPHELGEASWVDGARPGQSFWAITMPLLRPALTIAIVESLVSTINLFDQAYVLNGAAPLGSTVMLQTYYLAFQNLNFGQGYALSFAVTAFTIILSLIALRVIYRKVEL